MTQKQKLIQEYFNLKFQFEVNDGTINSEKVSAVDYIGAADMYYYSKRYKVYELQELIANLKNSINEQMKKKEREIYFSTEQGKKEKEELTAKLEYVQSEREILNAETSEKITAMFKEVIGENFLVNFSFGFSNYTIEVGLKENDDKMKFGHTFTLSYWDKMRYVNDKYITNYVLAMNYPTMGQFNLEDTDRVEYLAAMGKVASNKELQNNIKKVLDEHKNIDLEYRMEYRDIKKRLDF